MSPEWPTGWVILSDTTAWLLIHLGVSRLMAFVPDSAFQQTPSRKSGCLWEERGVIYRKVFRIMRWKDRIPDASRWFSWVRPKDSLGSRGLPSLQTFWVETQRAEITHWLMMLSSGVFVLWNRPLGIVILVGYALLSNVPCILTQRFNRARLRRILTKSV